MKASMPKAASRLMPPARRPVTVPSWIVRISRGRRNNAVDDADEHEVDADQLAAQRVEQSGEHAPAGVADDDVDLGSLHQLGHVDPADHRVDVDLADQPVDVDALDQAVHVDLLRPAR